MSTTVVTRRSLLLGAGAAGVLGFALAAGPRQLLGRAAAAVGPEGTPYTGRGKGGLLVQSGVGALGHFEAVLPGPASGIDNLTLNTDTGAWTSPVWTAGTASAAEGAAAVWSTFNHLELVVVVNREVWPWFRNPAGFWTTLGPVPGISDAVGWPGFIQSDRGTEGHFELVVPSAAGGLLFTQRNNDAYGYPWSAPIRFGSGTYRAVALMQSNYLTGGHGNLELVALKGSALEVWWRGGTGNWTLFPAAPIATNVAGAPALVQSTAGAVGNFEVIAPLVGGGLGHWWRDNDATGVPWSGPVVFGGSTAYRAAGLVAGPRGPQRNNLEVAGLRAAEPTADYYVRQGGVWSTPAPFWTRTSAPATQGAVDGTVNLDAIGIHAVLLASGDVVYWGFTVETEELASARLYTPSSRAVTNLAAPANIFCAGHARLPDGRVLIAGGHTTDAINGVVIFDPAARTFSRVGDMPNGRWYPTVTVLPDGRAIVMAGSENAGVSAFTVQNDTYQIWSGGALSRTELPTPVPFSNAWPWSAGRIQWYPFVFVLPNGQLLVHSRNTTRYLTDVDAATWSAVQHHTVENVDRTYPHEGSAVLLPLRHDQDYTARVLLTGGTTGNPGRFQRVSPTLPATPTCEILQVGGSGWRRTASMAKARLLHDLVLLPNGTVLAVGGAAYGASDFGDHPVAEAELFDPVTESWRTLAKISVPRGYHGTAILLPDGSVAIAGRDDDYQPYSLQYDEERLEVFKPPYCYAGTRPAITSGPAAAGYGSTHTFTISVAAGSSLRDVVLLRAGSVTHGNNMDQRLVTLARSGTGTVSVTMPPNGRIAPPGQYLVFAVDSAGLPSAGRFLRLG